MKKTKEKTKALRQVFATKVLIIVTLLTFSLVALQAGSVSSVEQLSGATVEGNTVSWNTSSMDMRVTPHTVMTLETVNGKSYYVQYVNVTRHTGAGNVDVAFGFNRLVKGAIDLWENVTTTAQTETLYNITTDFGNGTMINTTFKNLTLTSTTVLGWADKSSLFSKVEYQGTTYYFVQNLNVQPNQIVHGRLRFEKEGFNLRPLEKWQFFSKLSTDTISSAVSNSRYVLLDPWASGSQTYQSPIPFGTGAFNWTDSVSDVDYANSSVSFHESNVSARELVIRINPANAPNSNYEAGCGVVLNGTEKRPLLACFGGYEGASTNTLKFIDLTNFTYYTGSTVGTAVVQASGCGNGTDFYSRGGNGAVTQMVHYRATDGLKETVTASPFNKRLVHCFIYSDGGAVYVISPGGFDGTDSTTQIEVYNATNASAAQPYSAFPQALGTATRNYGAALIGSLITVVSGNGGGTATQIVNVSNRTTTPGATSPVSAISMCGVPLNGKAYIMAGSGTSNRVFSYNPVTNSFTNPSDSVMARGFSNDGQNCAAYQNVGWVYGGNDGGQISTIQRITAPQGNGTFYSRNISVGNVSQNSNSPAFNLTANVSTPAGTNISFNVSFDDGRTWANKVVLNENTSWTGATGHQSLVMATFTSGSSALSAALFNFSIRNASLPGGGGGGAATEVQGDTAIELGINSSLPSATKYSEQLAYVRNISNNHTLGRFDWVASFGSQRWLINYITAGESYVNAPNLTTAVYVLEIADKTSAQITDEVGRFINATKN